MKRETSAWEPQSLGPLQTAVMESLWHRGPLSAVELHELLSARQDWAYTTIHTELSRLLKKGLVQKRGSNLETRYAARMSRDEYLKASVKATLAELIGTHGPTAVHGFVELLEDDDAALEALRGAMRQRRRR